jgi:hypothetical protein
MFIDRRVLRESAIGDTPIFRLLYYSIGRIYANHVFRDWVEQMSEVPNGIDTNAMIAGRDLAESNIEYLDEVLELYERAQTYVESQASCQKVLEGWLDWGWGYILGIFLFHIEPTSKDGPEHVWAVIGDIPPASFEALECPDREAVMRKYVTGMRAWVACAQNSVTPGKEILEVNVPPTKEWAEKLGSRLDFIEEKIWPYL